MQIYSFFRSIPSFLRQRRSFSPRHRRLRPAISLFFGSFTLLRKPKFVHYGSGCHRELMCQGCRTGRKMRVRRISGQKGVSRVCRGFIKKSSKLLKYNNLEDYVWMTGLEPATSWSLTRCATNCATSRYDSLWGCKDNDYFPIIKGIFLSLSMYRHLLASIFAGFTSCRNYRAAASAVAVAA